MKYRPEVDGLRALAVVPVICFHAGFQLFSGGFVGVDVFFVISGYLITSIILAEKSAGTFSVLSFYERRARRIWPALFAVMFACLPFAWFWLLPQDMVNFSLGLAAVSLFASNILFWRTSGYFEMAAEFNPLLHTWSLAVEEQYYLLFPLLIMASWRLGRRWMWVILGAMATLSLLAAEWGATAKPAATFYLLPTRAWELLIGSLVAFYAAEEGKQFRPAVKQALSALGLVLIGASVFAFDKKTPFPSLYTLVPTVGAALILLFADGQTRVGMLLGSRLFVGIGLVSYSAYLWHQPLLALVRHRWAVSEPSELLSAALVAATFVLAYFSWRYVEKPFRDKTRFQRREVFIYGGACSVFFVLLGVAGILSQGFPHRLPKSLEKAAVEFPRIDNGWCFYSVDNLPALSVGAKGLQCQLGDRASKVRGLLFGDSFAGQYEPLWNQVGLENKLSITPVTTNWCFPSLNEEFVGPKSSRAFAQCLYNRKYLALNVEPYQFVVLGADWGEVLANKKMDGAYAVIDHLAPKVGVVVIMASPKRFDLNVMDAYRKSVWWGDPFDVRQTPARKDLAAVEANRLLENYSKKYHNVVFVDRASLFSVHGKTSDVTAEGVPFSFDGEHISIHGSKTAAATFLLSGKFAEFSHLLK